MNMRDQKIVIQFHNRITSLLFKYLKLIYQTYDDFAKYKYLDLKPEEKRKIIDVPHHVMEQDPPKNSKAITELIHVKDREMYFGKGKKKVTVKYSGGLSGDKMLGKGTVKSLDNSYTQKRSYDGEVYDGKEHGQGVYSQKVYKDGDYFIITDEGNFEYGEKHGLFTKTTFKKKVSKETIESTEYQRFSNGVPHVYLKTEKPDGSKVHQFEDIFFEDDKIFMTLKFEKNGSGTLIQNVTEMIEEDIHVRPASTSTEKKNGEGMDDK